MWQRGRLEWRFSQSISRKISEKCAAICEIPEIIRGNANEERSLTAEKLGETHRERQALGVITCGVVCILDLFFVEEEL